jgi:hypothetical protein
VAEPVDQRYVQPALAMSLPPLLKLDWDASVAHAPTIPLLDRQPRGAETEPAPDPLLDDEGNPTRPASEEFEDSAPAAASARRMAAQSNDLDEGPPAYRSETPADAELAGPQDVEFLLLRFFDFTIEPGKQYRYRVKLVLQHPEYREPTAKSPAPAGQRRLLEPAQWSDPTPAVAVPRPLQVLAGPVWSTAAGDVKARVRVVQFDTETGFEVSAARDVERGDVLNFTASNVVAIDWATRTVGRFKEYKFQNDAMLIDARPGKPLGGKETRPRENTATEPGEIQVVDSSGHVHVRSELDDATEYALWPGEAAAAADGPAPPSRAVDDLDGELDRLEGRPPPRRPRPGAKKPKEKSRPGD